uniref:Lymphocyte antigen 86 n=1 Tax=Sus scrofa TaxID=9823 RepID=A0A8D0VV67_PIG
MSREEAPQGPFLLGLLIFPGTQSAPAMRGFTAALLVWTLVSPQGGDGEAWPTHVACRDGNLEVLYQSCDPLQDFGFSVDQCSKQLKPNLHIRFGIILRQDIRELFLDVALFSQGSSILNFSYPICEADLPKFSFCGRRKGGRVPGSAGAVQPGPLHRGLRQRHGPLLLSVWECAELSRGNRGSSR